MILFFGGAWMDYCFWQCLVPKIPKILQDFPSHQIFGRMHGALNVGKK
jgi:hypothetical protein